MKIAGRNRIFPPLSIIMAANKKRKSINHLSVTRKQLTSLIRCTILRPKLIFILNPLMGLNFNRFSVNSQR